MPDHDFWLLAVYLCPERAMSIPTDNEEFEKWWQEWLISIEQRRGMPHTQPSPDAPVPDSDSIPFPRDYGLRDC